MLHCWNGWGGWRASRGVAWARFLAQALWRGEEYFFQTDSHMRFEKGWDTLLIEDIESCPGEKSVLASCAPPYLSPGDLITEVHPGLVTTVRRNVVIELTGEHTRERTVVDYRSVTGRAPNAEVGVAIDRERFIRLLRDAVATYD